MGNLAFYHNFPGIESPLDLFEDGVNVEYSPGCFYSYWTSEFTYTPPFSTIYILKDNCYGDPFQNWTINYYSFNGSTLTDIVAFTAADNGSWEVVPTDGWSSTLEFEQDTRFTGVSAPTFFIPSPTPTPTPSPAYPATPPDIVDTNIWNDPTNPYSPYTEYILSAVDLPLCTVRLMSVEGYLSQYVADTYVYNFYFKNLEYNIDVTHVLYEGLIGIPSFPPISQVEFYYKTRIEVGGLPAYFASSPKFKRAIPIKYPGTEYNIVEGGWSGAPANLFTLMFLPVYTSIAPWERRRRRLLGYC